MMKKSNTLVKSILAVVLSVVISVSMVSSAFAAVIINEELKLQYLYTFNDAVNAIKEEKPSFKYTKSSGISTKEESGNEDIPEEVVKYVAVIADAFFNPDSDIVSSIFGLIVENNSDITEKEISKGMDTTQLIAPYGKDYISALTIDDDYTLIAEDQKDILNPDNDSLKIRYTFDDCDLETKDSSSINKVFDLPSGVLKPIFMEGTNGEVKDPIDDIKFLEFRVHDAWVQADFNSKGELERFRQNISYTFTLSFYDIIRVFDAYTNINLLEDIGLAIANAILKHTGNSTLTPREALQATERTIRYDISVELSDFDWTPRFFGDVNNNGKVDANDARTVLRYSVGFNDIKQQEDLIYADVNFDGNVTALDARTILRMAVELEEEFNEVPEGESIKIIVITPPAPEPDDTPDEPDAPSDPSLPGGGSSWLPSTDKIGEGITEFIDSIFDIIDAIKGDSESDSGVNGLIQNIKDIIAAAKG